MLIAFERWITDQIEGRGLWTVVYAPVGVTLLVLGAGFVSDADVLRWIGILLLIAELFVLVLFLIGRQRATVDLLHSRTNTLRHYTEALAQLNKQVVYRYALWRESIILGKNGDAEVSRDVEIEVLEGDLHFFETGMTQYRDADLSTSERRRINVKVYSSNEDGSLGARCDATEIWIARGGVNRHGLQVHLPNTLAPGGKICLRLEWAWPGYSRALVRGGTEDFDWRFRPETTRVEVEVVLTAAARKGHKALPRVTPLADVDLPEVTQHGDQVCFKAQYDNPPQAMTPFGFVLDCSEVSK